MECDFCYKAIEGLYHYDIWGNKYHKKHNKTGVKCKSCSCLIMPSQESIILEDNTQICIHCSSESVLTIKQMNKCIKAVYKFYELGNIFFPKEKITFKMVTDNEQPSSVLGKYIYSMKKYEIQIKKGLTKSVFCSVLAHEMMHVYLNIQKIKLPLAEEEGLCEVSNYFVLKTIGDKLCEALIESMDKNDDPIYGYGFKLMRQKVIDAGGSLQNYLSIV